MLSLGVQVERAQVYGNAVRSPWALKPMVGVFSDSVLTFGYHKKYVMLVATVLGTLGAVVLSFGVSVELIVVFGMFLLSLQASVLDLLTEAKYSEVMKEHPSTSSSISVFANGAQRLGYVVRKRRNRTCRGLFFLLFFCFFCFFFFDSQKKVGLCCCWSVAGRWVLSCVVHRDVCDVRLAGGPDHAELLARGSDRKNCGHDRLLCAAGRLAKDQKRVPNAAAHRLVWRGLGVAVAAPSVLENSSRSLGFDSPLLWRHGSLCRAGLFRVSIAHDEQSGLFSRFGQDPKAQPRQCARLLLHKVILFCVLGASLIFWGVLQVNACMAVRN